MMRYEPHEPALRVERGLHGASTSRRRVEAPVDLTLQRPAAPQGEEEPLDLFDFGFFRDWGGFAFDAIRAHFVRTILVFTSVLAAAGAWLQWGPRVYHTQSVILAQRNQVIPNLANPKRAVPSESDAPTWAAKETVLQRENLVALIKQSDLVDQWISTRPKLLRWKDRAMEALVGPMDENDVIDAMVSTLQTHLDISAKEGTVTIGIDWPDPTMAFRLVEAAQQNFLEARHAAEVSMIAESIAILEQNVADNRVNVERLLAGSGEAAATNPVPSNATPKRADPASNRERLRVLAEAKQRTIDDLEDFRRKRLGELQVRLAEEKTIYGPTHPLIAATQQSVLALSQESPQVARLRQEAEELRAQYQAAAPVEAAAAANGLRVESEGRAVAPPPHPLPRDEAAKAYAEQRMRIEVDKYEDLLDRLSSARIEMEATRAAFKYRYSVVEPPSVPKHRTKPKVPPFVVGSVVFAFLAGAASSVVADWRIGRIAKPWQVERQLRLSVLAEVSES